MGVCICRAGKLNNAHNCITDWIYAPKIGGLGLLLSDPVPAGLFRARSQCGLKRPFSEACNFSLCRLSRHNIKGTEVPPPPFREQRFHHYTLKETEVP